MDRYVTLIILAAWKTAKHCTIVGTMRLDRIGIPKEITSIERREKKATIYPNQSNGDSLLVF